MGLVEGVEDVSADVSFGSFECQLLLMGGYSGRPSPADFVQDCTGPQSWRTSRSWKCLPSRPSSPRRGAGSTQADGSLWCPGVHINQVLPVTPVLWNSQRQCRDLHVGTAYRKILVAMLTVGEKDGRNLVMLHKISTVLAEGQSGTAYIHFFERAKGAANCDGG